jgi:hypothetical protein
LDEPRHLAFAGVEQARCPRRDLPARHRYSRSPTALKA